MKNIINLPTLDSERLILRKLNKKDYKDAFEFYSNPKVPEYLLWEPHPDLKYTKSYLKYVVSKYKTGEYSDYAIVLKSSDKVIGTCGYTSFDMKSAKAEIGYVLNEEYWNMGYAHEAVKTLISYSFFILNLKRLDARVIVGNESSVKLLEKCGFKYEGTGVSELFVKGEFKDIMHFALLNENYKETKGALR